MHQSYAPIFLFFPSVHNLGTK